MLTINESDFQRLVQFVKNDYGINLSKKKQLITGRLSNTIISMGFDTFQEYVDYLIKNKKPEDLELMLNKLTTNYTYFMREESHFDFFTKTILPYLETKKKDRVLSIWSAGCSSGEEPYTISMYLKEFFGPQANQWDTRILATDISQKILDSAITAVYNEESTAALPPAWQKKYFVKNGPDRYTIAPAIKQNVIFRTFNLMDSITFKKKFDLIFCRNVMIYFDQATKDALVRRFYNATVPGGHLFIGHSEGLTKATCPYEYVQPAIYRKA